MSRTKRRFSRGAVAAVVLFATALALLLLWLSPLGNAWEQSAAEAMAQFREYMRQAGPSASFSSAITQPSDTIKGSSPGETAATTPSDVVLTNPTQTTQPLQPDPFTLAWISDTQLYSESYPAIFHSMTTWLADNAEKENIRYLLHTGDVVNNRNSDGQWKNAVEAMNRLTGKLPFLIAAGNHDVGAPTGDYSRFTPRFGQTEPVGGGLWEGGKGQYALLDAGGLSLLIVMMGYGTGDEGIAWTNSILAKYPDRYAILGVHSYMHETGVLTTLGKGIYQKIVVPNPNVRLVLCGHHHAAGRKSTELDDNGDGQTDRTVYQILADYQAAGQGGGGFLRLLTFDKAANRLQVRTYSPYLEKNSFYEDPDIDTFELPLF